MKSQIKKGLQMACLAAAVAAAGLVTINAQTASFTFYGPLGRFITPNGDGINDIAIFCFANPNDSSVTGKIFSLLGRNVSSMTQQNPALAGCPQSGLNPQSMTWNGTMNGRTVSSGVYIYQITAEGRSYTGSIVVVR